METNMRAKKREIGLILRRVGQAAGKLNPFKVGKFVEEALGYRPKADFDKQNNCVFYVKTEKQAMKLTRMKKLEKGIKIKIERPLEKKAVKCIIQSRVITEMPDDELADNLRQQGVVKLRSIKPENRLKMKL